MPSSAQTLLDLEALLLESATDRGRRAWELVTRAQANADFHAVLDFALDKGLVLPCAVGDPKREPNLTWTNPLDGSEMVWIPPGKFLVGNEKMVAECAGFSLAKYPVTNRQFNDFHLATSYPSAEVDALHDSEVGYVNGHIYQQWEDEPPSAGDDHPMVYVSYLDALAYCEWAGLSVPGEYQWEKAARGTDGRLYPWGDTNPAYHRRRGTVRPLTHFQTSSTAAVDALPRVRSPYGCEQMAGNVSTWCQQGDGTKPGEFPPPHPKAEGYAAVRGGAFKRQGVESLRTYHRRRLSVIRRNDWVGIRPACLLPVRPAVD